MENKPIIFLVFVAAVSMNLIFIGACSMTNETKNLTENQSVNDYPYVFFGHQSVGNNVLTGIEEIGIDGFNVATVGDVMRHDALIVHKFIGRNGYPLEKIEDFKQTLLNWTDEREPDIAVMKLCFVDILHDTDINDLFAEYQKAVREIKAEKPDMTIVHMTVPLETHDSTIKGIIKRILGRPSFVYAYNINRERYNVLIREYYGDRYLFDIAKIESTKSNGQRVLFHQNGETGYVLFDEYAADSGHLNKKGREWIACHFIEFLGKINNNLTGNT